MAFGYRGGAVFLTVAFDDLDLVARSLLSRLLDGLHGVRFEVTTLRFKGWWGDGDEKDTPKWETFHVILNGIEAGDMATSPREVHRILKLAGYRLRIEKIRRRK